MLKWKLVGERWLCGERKTSWALARQRNETELPVSELALNLPDASTTPDWVGCLEISFTSSKQKARGQIERRP